MRRILALLEKEARHHALIVVGLVLLLPTAYAMVALTVYVSPARVTFFLAHNVFLWAFVPLTAMVLGNRLIVTEYQGRTQLFVEALPIRRVEMVAVKYALGLIAVMAVAAGSLLITALIASTTEPVNAPLALFLTLRTGVYVLCLWAVLFAMGFLGRFRVPLYIALVLALIAIDSLTDLDVWRFGPFELVGEQMGLERESFPWGAFATTLVLAVVFTGLGFLLPMMNEGSLAESLARRMTLKEKSVAGGLFVAATIAITALGERREKEPFSFQSQAVVASERAPLEVLYRTEPARADAEALRDRVEVDLVDLRDTLGWKSLPTARISLWTSLEGDEFERVELSKNEGVLVRADFRRSPGWDEPGFRAFLIERVLDATTEGRASYEPEAWFREGLARYWAEREQAAACRETPADCPPLLRAIWLDARHGPVTAARINAWIRFRERYGEPLSQAVAFSLALSLERQAGREAVVSLAREVYGRHIPMDLREVIRARRHPWPEVFEEATGLGWEPFLQEWRSELSALRALPEVAEALEQVPEAWAEVTVERDHGSIRSVIAHARFSAPPPEGTRLLLLHCGLSPFDRPLERRELLREELAVSGTEARGELMGRYGPGSRVFLALELESETLGCPIRLLAQRREIR